jgi:hypothetical protein
MRKVNNYKLRKETTVLQNEPVGNALVIRGRLNLLGWKSINAWAQVHGYKSGSVLAAVRTWGLRTDRAPHGGISRAVMRDLRLTIAHEIRPASADSLAGDAPSLDLFPIAQTIQG